MQDVPNHTAIVAPDGRTLPPVLEVERRETTERPSGPPRTGTATFFTALFGLVGWAVGTARLGDNSFLWHLRTGEWILDHGIPHHDPFSFTARGTSWVAQSWLAELLYGTLDRVMGAFGIRLAVGVAAVAVAVGVFRLALRCASSPLVAALVAAVSLAGPFLVWSERPLSFGLVLLLALVWCVEAPSSPLGRHAAVAIPVILVVWVNVHGTFVLGFAYLALHLLGRWIEGATPWRSSERRLLQGGAVASVLVFANPYGPKLVFFPLHLLSRGDILQRVVEWESPSFRTTIGQAFAVWLLVLLVVAARSGRLSRRDLVVIVPMIALALWAQRNVAIAPIVGVPILGARARARCRSTSRRSIAARAGSRSPWSRSSRSASGSRPPGNPTSRSTSTRRTRCDGSIVRGCSAAGC